MGARQEKPQAATIAHCLLLLLWKEATFSLEVGPGRGKVRGPGQKGVPTGALELRLGGRTSPCALPWGGAAAWVPEIPTEELVSQWPGAGSEELMAL